MTIGNISAVFAPNLLRPRHESMESLKDTVHVVNLLATLVGRAHDVFHIQQSTRNDIAPHLGPSGTRGSDHDRVSSAARSSDFGSCNGRLLGESGCSGFYDGRFLHRSS